MWFVQTRVLPTILRIVDRVFVALSTGIPLLPAQLAGGLAATLARVVDALVVLVSDLSLALGTDLTGLLAVLAVVDHQFA